MPFTPLRLPDIQQARTIVDKDGRPTPEFVSWLNNSLRNIGNVLGELVDFATAIQAAQDAAAAANEAALAAQTAADAANVAVADAEAAIGTIDTTLTDHEARLVALEP
jgi:hypothetical protein